MAARQALECEEDHSNSVIKITNCRRTSLPVRLSCVLARKQQCVPALGVVMSASMQAPGAPAESQIPATNNHPLTIKAASWRVLIANQ